VLLTTISSILKYLDIAVLGEFRIQVLYFALFYDVYVMLFHAGGQGPPVVGSLVFMVLRILNRCEIMISNEVSADWAKGLGIESVLVHSCLVSNLVGNKLGMVTGGYALVDDFVLFYTLLYRRVHELRHFNIVCENVKW